MEDLSVSFNDFLSFAKNVERDNEKIHISQKHNGKEVCYPFRLLCRLETQSSVIFRVSGNNHDFDFNPKKPLTFSSEDEEFEMPPNSFIFDRFYIILKYNSVKISADDTLNAKGDDRKNTRFKIKKEFKAKVELSSLRIAEKVAGFLLDISQSGASILLQEKHATPLLAGDIIDIKRIAHEKVDMLEASVVHKSLIDEENRHYKLAIQFTTPLKMTKVLALVKSCKVGFPEEN